MAHRTLFLTQHGARHQQDALRSAPPELELVIRRDPSREELLRLLPDMEFLISERSGSIDAEHIGAGHSLKLIQRLGSQTWDIDLEAARRAGIPVCSWPLRSCMLVAEHMVLQMLGTARRLRELMHISAEAAPWAEPRRSDEDTFAYNWSRRKDVRGLAGATVGILGFGEIGWELAKRLRAFDCAVLYYKRRPLPPQAEQTLGIRYAAQPDLIRNSDFVCSLLPLTDATRMLANADFFVAMKPGSIFVHCGAGGVVDEAALAGALRSGRLVGAALDTYDWEPLRPDDQLLALARDPLQNLILTPHVAAGTRPHAASAAVQETEGILTASSWTPAAGTDESARARRSAEYTNPMAVLAGQHLQHRIV